MDARCLILLILLAGCSRDTAKSSDASGEEEVHRISYAEATKVFEAAQKKYDQLVNLQAAAVQRQKELEAGDSDPDKAEQAALVDKLTQRVADQKKVLTVAKQAKDEAYIRENPASPEESEKAFRESHIRPR